MERVLKAVGQAATDTLSAPRSQHCVTTGFQPFAYPLHHWSSFSLQTSGDRFCMAAVSLSVSTVTPLGDRVLVKVAAAEEKTAGGILLPDNAKEKPQVGEVVAVGPGKRNDDGSRQAPEVSTGNKVLYSKYAGTDIKLGGEDYVLLSEKDILAVVG